MIRRVMIREYEKGLLFRDGRFVRSLEAGRQWVRGEVTIVDLRRRDTMVDAGPVLTRTLVPIGVRLLVSYRVTDPERAVLQTFEYRAHLVNDATASIHRAVSLVALEDLSAEHNRLEQSIQDRLAIEAVSYGLRVEDVSILQIRLPRALRRRLKHMEVGP